MAVRILFGLGHPVLRMQARKVRHLGTYERQLLRDLADTCLAVSNCVGLSAPQLGVPLRLAVVRATEHSVVELVNPEIVEVADEWETEEEGCMSIPGVLVPVARPAWVVVRDAAGKRKRRFVEVAGRAVQHEIDHLNGVLIVDYQGAAAVPSGA